MIGGSVWRLRLAGGRPASVRIPGIHSRRTIVIGGIVVVALFAALLLVIRRVAMKADGSEWPPRGGNPVE
jgi:hypothetical protein